MATSLIFNSKDDAKQYLLNQTEGPDGKHMIARYWKGGEGSDIASVEGILHRTNGVVNVEVKDTDNGGSSVSSVERKYVVRKAVPLYPEGKYNYFFQGGCIKFEVPRLRDGDVMQLIFPYGFGPANTLWGLAPGVTEINSRDDFPTFRDRFLLHAERVKFYNTHYDLEGKRRVSSCNLLWALYAGYLYMSVKLCEEDQCLIIMLHNRFSLAGGPGGTIGNDGSRGPSSDDLLDRNARSGMTTSNFSITLKTNNGVNGQVVRCESMDPEDREGYFCTTLFRKEDLEAIGLTVDDGYTGSTAYFATMASKRVMRGYGTPVFENIPSNEKYWYHEDQTGLDSQKVRLIAVDFRYRFNYTTNWYLTAETTSPGFRIENGKIKCYKKSSLLYSLNKFDEDINAWRGVAYPYRPENYYKIQTGLNEKFPRTKIKYIKDETVFYYHPRNIHNGITPDIVAKTHMMLDVMFGSFHSYGEHTKQYKEDSRVEYLGRARMRLYKPNTSGSGADPHNNIFLCPRYVGIDQETGKWKFSIWKTDSQWPLKALKIFVSVTGVDGNKKEGYVVLDAGENDDENILPTTGGTYFVYSSELHLKDEQGNYYNTSFDASSTYMILGATNIKIDFITSGSGYYFNARIPNQAIRILTETRVKRWKLLNRHKPHYGSSPIPFVLPSYFIKKYFNTCRYYKKFKGVKSEFPETFYTR